ncbi:MAG: sporulation protein YqfD [Cellulosilyticaceae bacterium]
MFVSLWNYLKGYVIVEVSGYAIEKFMNLALKTGISFWNVENKEGKLYLCTTIKGFKALKPYAQKSRCRLKIVKKIGLPFISFRYRKRSLLAGGGFVFVILLYILTSFVWLIEVEGNSRISETDIINTLTQEGYGVGRLKNNLDLRDAEQKLIQTYPDITWTGVKFEGTKLLIQVAETVPKPKMHDETMPCHLVAKRDALITYIATDKGMPQVKKGDTVRKGETLVSGEITLQDEAMTKQYTHAKAQVKGRTFYALQAQVPLYKTNKNYTQNISKKYSIRLFNKKIPLYHQKKALEQFDTLLTVNQFKITELFPLPFYFEKEERVEYIPEVVSISEEEAQDKLEGILHDELMEMLSSDGQILDKEVVYRQDGQMLIGELHAVVQEDIVEIKEITEEEIQMNSQNQEQSKGVNE